MALTQLRHPRRIARPLVRQLAAIDDPPRLVSHIACDDVQLTVRQFLAGDIGKQALGLLPRFFEAVELVAHLVAMETTPISDVEIIPSHVPSDRPGKGTRLPQAPVP